MSDREVRLVVRKAATGDFSASQIKELVSSAASLRTVQRVLASVDWLQYAKMDNTLELTAEHMIARHEFAKEWLLYSKDDLRVPRRQTVRRQNGGGSLMVWGGFS
ncbi:hypothetical protein PHYSODRAFT_372347, partial [Phytophthora sojae]